MKNILQRALTTALPTLPALLLALLAGAAVAIPLLSWGLITGASPRAWFPGGDQAQALIGLLYYLHDDWRLPLLFAANLGPSGANIAFTDSIPLLAVPTRLWFSVTGQVVNYFGAWMLLCILLQTVAFVLLLRHFGRRTLAVTLAGALLAATLPLLLMRLYMEHLALSGQFLVLFAWLLFFRDTAAIRDGERGYWLALLAAALWVHPYFMAMVLTIFLAARLDALLAGRGLVRQGLETALALVWLLALMLLSGHLTLGAAPAPAPVDNIYSLNLLAPLLPQGLSGWFPGRGHMDATGGQALEGFIYPGAGLLLALALAFASALGRRLGPWGSGERLTAPEAPPLRPATLAILLALGLGLTLYALSPDIYALKHRLLSYDPPWPLETLLGHFRVSARLIWPLVYLVLLFTVLALTAWLPPARAALALTLIAAVQWVDTQPLRAVLSERNRTPVPIADERHWQDLIAHHERLLIFPPMFCGPREEQMHLNFGLHLVAARHGLSTNSLYAARWTPDCAEAAHAALSTPLTPGALMVYHAPPYYGRPAPDTPAGEPPADICRGFAGGWACSLDWSTLPETARRAWSHDVTPLPLLTVGSSLRFTLDGRGGPYLGRGWSFSETWGTWSDGPVSTLHLPLAQPIQHDPRLRLDIHPFLAGALQSQRVRVLVNDEPLADWTLGPGIAPPELRIPAGLARARPILELRFEIADPRSPASLGLSPDDQRALGIGLVGLQLLQ